MKERSFDEMIAYFNRRVSEMDIAQDYKMELLGMVTALGYKHEKTAQRWIPIKTRPMDEEERKEWSEKIGYDLEDDEAVIFVSQLPDDGQEVLTCSRYGNVCIDTFTNDPDYGCGFEENGDMDGIVAWMPLPEPWEGEQS